MEMLAPYIPRRTLQTVNQGLLVEQTGRLKTVGDRAFEVAAPKLWNALEQVLRQCESIEGFKAGLKTLLFREIWLSTVCRLSVLDCVELYNFICELCFS